MARPRKFRSVCDLPENTQFVPLGSCRRNLEVTAMTVEQYETIRLIDLEGLTQEECAESMDVARTTVQRIYMEARKIVAEFLVNGNMLQIDGGNYKLCKDREHPNRCGMCRRKNLVSAISVEEE